jgi:hypothetical protein
MKYDATEIRPGRYAVRPAGQLGTCGYFPVAWSVRYVNAPTADAALRKSALIDRRNLPDSPEIPIVSAADGRAMPNVRRV